MQQPFPISEANPATFGDPLPDSVDVAVIGAGVVGTFSALFARRKGLSVALLEKGRVAGEQSSRNWGWIRQQGRDREETPIVMESKRLWESTDKELGGKAGFVQGGTTYLANSEAEMAKLESWMDIARHNQLDTRMIPEKELAGIIEQGSSKNGRHQWVGGLHTPSDARAEPWLAVPAVARMAHAEGVNICENCAVRAFEITGGKITGVVTEKGTVKCQQVVVAAGAWTSLFLKRHGISIPQLAVLASVARTAKMPEVLRGCAADEELAFRRREDGGYSLALCDHHQFFAGRDAFRNFTTYLPVIKHTLSDTVFRAAAPKGFPDAWTTPRKWNEDDESPFERMRVLNPKPSKGAAEKMQKRFAARFPALGAPKLLNVWAGMIDTMPDIVPIVDRVPDHENLIIATGMSGHGFGAGPGFASAIAKMLAWIPTGHDMSRFRFSRFTDGSKLRPGPHI